MNDELQVAGCIWEPDDRDYLVENILGAEDWETASIPESVILDIEEYNQGALAETAYACTTYSTYHALKASIEFVRKVNQDLDPLKGFRKQKAYGTYIENTGDYLRTAFKSVIENGLYTESGETLGVEGFALIGYGHLIDPKKINYYLSKGLALVTSFDIRKGQTYKSKGYLTPSLGAITGGHAVSINGYRSGEKIISNSYDKGWGKFKDGTFRIKDEDLHLLKGIYVLYPKPKVNMLYKDISELAPHFAEIKKVKDLGLMTGYPDGAFRPEQPMTRQEVAIVLARMAEKLGL